ncbi:ribonuclease H-like domain, reverse transcriptase, RNA-dependent DNA polymerase [Tanacetum coccineum]
MKINTSYPKDSIRHELDFDDLYNNLKVYEHELKGVSNSNSQNIAFLSTEVKGSTLKQSTAEPTNIPKDIHKLPQARTCSILDKDLDLGGLCTGAIKMMIFTPDISSFNGNKLSCDDEETDVSESQKENCLLTQRTSEYFENGLQQSKQCLVKILGQKDWEHRGLVQGETSQFGTNQRRGKHSNFSETLGTLTKEILNSISSTTKDGASRGKSQGLCIIDSDVWKYDMRQDKLSRFLRVQSGYVAFGNDSQSSRKNECLQLGSKGLLVPSGNHFVWLQRQLRMKVYYGTEDWGCQLQKYQQVNSTGHLAKTIEEKNVRDLLNCPHGLNLDCFCREYKHEKEEHMLQRKFPSSAEQALHMSFTANSPPPSTGQYTYRSGMIDTPKMCFSTNSFDAEEGGGVMKVGLKRLPEEPGFNSSLHEVWVLCELPEGQMGDWILKWVFRYHESIHEGGYYYQEQSTTSCTRMDVKSAFLYGNITEEVYVKQPPGFEDPAHPNKHGYTERDIDKNLARFPVTPKVSHLHAVKRIFRYLKHQPNLGLWYPKDSPFHLEAFSDSDYAGDNHDRRSTSRRMQFVAERLNHRFSLEDQAYQNSDITSFEIVWSKGSLDSVVKRGLDRPQDFIPSVSLPSKVFTFMRKHSTKFSCRITPLTPSMLEVVSALAAEEEQSTSPHSRAASSARCSSALNSKCCSFKRTVQYRTADFQGTAEPHDAASIPKSPNDYTPTDVFPKSGGPSCHSVPIHGWTMKKQHNCCLKFLLLISRQEVRASWSHTISTSQPTQGRYSALETTNDEEVARKIQAEWDAEEERKRFEELKKTKPKTTLRTYYLLLRKEINGEFPKGQGYKKFAKNLSIHSMKGNVCKFQASIKDSFKDFIFNGFGERREIEKERDAKRTLKEKGTLQY